MPRAEDGPILMPILAIAVAVFLVAASPVSAEINAGDLDGAATVTADFPADGGGAPQAAGGYVSCPAGQKVFTGSAFWWRNVAGTTGSPNLILYSSTPTFDGNGWYADGLNAKEEVWNLRVLARCLPERKLNAVKLRKETVGNEIPAGTVDRRARCPDGTRIISGGAFWHRAGAAPDYIDAVYGGLASSAPMGTRTWYAAGVNTAVDEGHRLTVVARCLASNRLSAYKRLEDRFRLQSGGSWASGLECGGSRRVGPTGVYFHKPGQPPKPALGDDIVLTALGAGSNPGLAVDGGAVVGPATVIRESLSFCLAP